MISLMMKFRRGPIDLGLKVGSGGHWLWSKMSLLHMLYDITAEANITLFLLKSSSGPLGFTLLTRAKFDGKI